MRSLSNRRRAGKRCEKEREEEKVKAGKKYEKNGERRSEGDKDEAKH